VGLRSKRAVVGLLAFVSAGALSVVPAHASEWVWGQGIAAAPEVQSGIVAGPETQSGIVGVDNPSSSGMGAVPNGVAPGTSSSVGGQYSLGVKIGKTQCQAKNEKVTQPGGRVWNTKYYCGSFAGTPVSNGASYTWKNGWKQVGTVNSHAASTSGGMYVVCWKEGATYKTNNVWYWVKSDNTGAWGWMSASNTRVGKSFETNLPASARCPF